MTHPVFDMVVVLDLERGIARASAIPWRLTADLGHFRRLTTVTRDPERQNAVIMGRGTWDPLPPRFRPLPRRHNVVISRRSALDLPEGVVHARSLDEALAHAHERQRAGHVERVFVIGGGEIYAQAIALPGCRDLYVTRVERTFGCDVFFPAYEDEFERTAVLGDGTENGLDYRIEVWRRPGFVAPAGA